MFFNKKIFSSIGLDISDLSLRMIQLYKKGDKIKIQSIGEKKIPEGLIKNGEITNQKEIVKAISDLFAKPNFGSLNGNGVVECLPESKTFLKLIEIEDHPNQLEDTILNEMEKHIPFPPGKVFYDWQKITNKKSNKENILFGAAEKNIANQYIEMLTEAKLSINALEIESTAICRSVLREESSKYSGVYNKNYCIIDIGAKKSCMTIYSKNTIITTLSVPISGEDTTKKIAKTLEIDQDQAEKAKIVCGLDKNKAKGIVNEILSDMSKKLIKKIKSSIDFYHEHYPHHGDIDQILLCGGGANINNLDKLLTEKTAIDAKIINPLVNINEISESFKEYFQKKDSQNHKLEQNLSFSFSTAIGLALRDII